MTGENPLLSVVIPVYNVAPYLADSLRSIQQQVVEDIEVIVVDDESTDGSDRVAREFAERDPRFRIITQPNAGPGIARNTGFRAATGRYLTFADGDDLVTPRGYAAMVACLEETGSAIAAGNAYRFSEAKGVYQSWTHRLIFAESALRTTIQDSPLLVKDRMMWNKVYRRSFWDAGGFEFPDMRVLEDYIVALRAYLEAPSVDLLSQHVYLWRERPSRDSITQQVSNLQHAADRFSAARDVLQMVAAHTTDRDVLQEIMSSFQHVDLVSLAESMVAVPEIDQPQAEQYATDLAHMIDPTLATDTSRLARLVHRSLLSGDVQLARDVAQWRLTGDTHTLIATLREQKRYSRLPVALGAVVARRKPQNPAKARKLRSSLVWAHWSDDQLHLTILSTLRTDMARRVSAHLLLIPAEGRVVRIPVDTVPTDNAVQVHAAIPADVLRDPPSWEYLRVAVQLRSGPFTWRGPVATRAALFPPIHPLGDGSWAQVRGLGWYLAVERISNPILVDSVEVDGDDFVLRADSGQPAIDLQVDRPFPTAGIGFRLEGAARLSAATLLADDPPDNPVTMVAERPISIREPATDRPLWWVRLPSDTDADGDEIPEPPQRVFLRGHPASRPVGDRLVSLTRGWYGTLVVRQAPLGATSGAADVAGTPPVDLLVAEDAEAAIDPIGSPSAN